MTTILPWFSLVVSVIIVLVMVWIYIELESDFKEKVKECVEKYGDDCELNNGV